MICNGLITRSCTHEPGLTPGLIFMLAGIVPNSEACLYLKGGRACDSPAVLKCPTDTADGSRGGVPDAHQRERKSSWKQVRALSPQCFQILESLQWPPSDRG